MRTAKITVREELDGNGYTSEIDNRGEQASGCSPDEALGDAVRSLWLGGFFEGPVRLDIEILHWEDLIDKQRETELRDAWEGEGNSTRVTFEKWVAAMADNDSGTLQESAKLYLAAKTLENER